MAQRALAPEEHQRRLDAVEQYRPTGKGWPAKAAKALGVKLNTFYGWMSEHGIRSGSGAGQRAIARAAKIIFLS